MEKIRIKLLFICTLFISCLYNSQTTVPNCSNPPLLSGSSSGVPILPYISLSSISTVQTSGYRIYLGTVSGVYNVLNGVIASGAYYYFTTPLLPGTNYYMKVIPFNNLGPAVGCNEISFTTEQINCPQINSLTTSNTEIPILPTFSWQPVSGADGYKITVSNGSTEVISNLDVGNTTSFTMPTPLSYSTGYKLGVVSYTSYGSVSTGCIPKEFYTQCAPVNAFFHHFEMNGNFQKPYCWAEVENTGKSVVVFGELSLNYFQINPVPVVLAMPETNTLSTNQYRLMFKMRYANSQQTPIQLGYIGDINSQASFVPLATFTADTPTYKLYGLNITGIPAGIKRLAFKDPGTGSSVIIDDVTYALIPPCEEMNGTPVVSNITDTSADISWLAPVPPASLPGNGYDLYYNQNGIAPSAATVPQYTGISGLSKTIPVSRSSKYFVWVRTNCGSSVGNWSPVLQFGTPCQLIESFTEDFEDTSAVIPYCFTNLGTTNGALIKSWEGGNGPISGNRSLFLSTFGSNNPFIAFKTVSTLQTGDYTVKLKAKNGNNIPDIFLYLGYIDMAGNFVLLNTFALPQNSGIVQDYSYNVPILPAGVTKLALKTNSLLTVVDDLSYELNTSLSTSNVIAKNGGIQVYPNPVSDILNLSSIKDIKKIVINDVSGKNVMEINNPTLKINLSGLNSGMYFLNLKIKDGTVVQIIKIIKK